MAMYVRLAGCAAAVKMSYEISDYYYELVRRSRIIIITILGCLYCYIRSDDFTCSGL